MPCAALPRKRHCSRIGAVCAAAVFFAGCGLPRDPEGTLDRVRTHALRVGVDVSEPWTAWKGDEPQGRPVGIEPELIERFAAGLDAEVEWVRGSETELLTAL